ncbi:MAG TPA: DUF1028 domain-containing protein [Kofleriaceae bacterium]|nr:DUF1028 domain-containing protein [Kofleriaceae bacterium]
MRLVLVVGVVVVVVLAAHPAHATYSIVATDTATRQVGGAVTSCVGTLSVSIVYGGVPGKGAVHAQAQLGGPGKNAAVMQLGMDVDPAAIITSITATAFDANAQRRQYGIVDLMARSAGFTGTQTSPFTDDRQAQIGTYTYSVQGNILTSAAVLDQAAASFQTQGCDLADKLMLALEAGAQNGEGDSRCTGSGIPSDSAFLEVDREGEAAGTYLRLDVTNTSPQSPLVLLRAQYDAWRVTHPCPAPPMPDAGAGGDGGIDDMSDDGGGCCSGSGDSNSWPLVLVVGVLRRRSRART